MEALKRVLKRQLAEAKRIALLGVGSELRGDDAAGILVIKQLAKESRKAKLRQKFRIFAGGTAPENLTGEIKRFGPTHLLIIDSADTGKKPGAVILLKPEKAVGVSFCTHQLPLKIMIDYLVESIACRVLIIGIQPKKLAFGNSLTKEVGKAVKQVAAALRGIINNAVAA